MAGSDVDDLATNLAHEIEAPRDQNEVVVARTLARVREGGDPARVFGGGAPARRTACATSRALIARGDRGAQQ